MQVSMFSNNDTYLPTNPFQRLKIKCKYGTSYHACMHAYEKDLMVP